MIKKITVSSKKAATTHLVAAVVGVVLLACVRMASVVGMAQVVIPTSTMLGQEVWLIMGIVALWYLVWIGIIVSLVVRVCARAIYTYIK